MCFCAPMAALTLKATDLDLEVTETVPAEIEQPGATTVPAHILYDIVRKLPDGAEVSLDTGDGRAARVKAGRSRFPLQVLPEADFPDLTAGDFPTRFTLPASAREDADRPHPVRHLDRGDALLSQRHLPPRRRRSTASRCCAPWRPTATASPRRRSRRRPAPSSMPGVIVPRKTVGEMQKLVEDAGCRSRGRALRHQDPRHARHRRADLEADRRHLPRLCAGHPAGQRQDPEGRQGRVRQRRRPRVDDVERARPRGQAGALRRPAGAVGQQSRFRQRQRGARRRLSRPTRSRSASTRNTCSTSPASSRARPPTSASPIPARRP